MSPGSCTFYMVHPYIELGSLISLIVLLIFFLPKTSYEQNILCISLRNSLHLSKLFLQWLVALKPTILGEIKLLKRLAGYISYASSRNNVIFSPKHFLLAYLRNFFTSLPYPTPNITLRNWNFLKRET